MSRNRTFTAVFLAASIFAYYGETTTSLAAEPGNTASNGAAERNEILNSEAWRQTMLALDEWLSVQKIYEPKQAAQMRDRIVKRASQMSADELSDFMAELQAKLKILLGAEARDARQWLNETLATASDKYAKKVRAGLPDVAKMTPEQIQEELDEFERRRAQTRESRSAFERAEQARIKAVEADLKQQREASEKALDRAAASARQGYYSPSRQVRQYQSQQPPYFPFFWGAYRW
ncbi:MAG TPA: hypothetical protein VHB99_09800 [Pirellulales bacterium]|nr:hypothetical protein [Pirellulales bacterium]